MLRFVESIKISNGTISDLEYHTRRFNATMIAVFGKIISTDLIDLLRVPEEYSSGIYKCRILYSSSIEKIEFAPYHKREIRNIKLVYDNTIDYTFKYEDKSSLEKLKALHPEFDDILIVKNGIITDTSFSNAAFFDGAEWYTPSSPLLRGTKREKLISAGIIKPAEIRPEDIHYYKKLSFINAMLDLEDSMINTDCITQ